MPADIRVFGMNILPSVDQQGLGKVTKAIQTALSDNIIDAKTVKNFGAMAKSSATEFNKTINKAKLAGLHDSADHWRKTMLETETLLVKKMGEMEKAQAKFNADGNKKDLQASQRRIKDELEAQNLRLGKEMKQVDDIIDRQAKAKEMWGSSKAVAETGEALADGFSDGVSDLWRNFKSADLGGFGKALSGVVGKAGKGLKAAGAAGAGPGGGAAATAMAGTLATAAAAVAAVAAVVAAIAAVVAIMVAADSQAKEFNATLLKGASQADFFSQEANDGIMDMTDSLKAAQDASVGLAWEFRGDAKAIMEVLSAANEAGLTFKEMQKAVGGNVTEMEAYAKVARTAIVYSKTLGQSMDTIATQTAEWMHDLGGGLKTVEDGFGAIFQGAQQSGIGVKRFYGMITAATSNMAMYNIRIEEAAALVATLGKSLGEANAASFTEGLTKGFAHESYTERFKRIMIAGKGDMSEIMENSAVSTAEAFQKKFGQEVPKAMQDIAKKGGVNLNAAIGGDTEELAKLGKMGERQIRDLLQATESNEEYRELEKLVELSRGMGGSISDQAKALDAMDMTGKLATVLSGGLGGKAISEMSAHQLAAFEGYAGISGQQLTELRKVDRQLRGQYDTLSDIKKAGGKGTEAQIKKLEELGLRLGKNGKIYVGETDKVVDSYNDYAQSQGHVLQEAMKGSLSDQDALALRMAEDTSSMLNSIDTGMIIILGKIYDVMQQLLSWAGGLNKTERKAKDELLAQMQSEEAAITESLRTNAEEMTKARDETHTNPGEAADKHLKELQKQRAILEAGAEVSRREQHNVSQVQGGWFDNWNDADEMRGAMGLSDEEKAKIYSKGGGGLPEGAEERAAVTADRSAKDQARRESQSVFGGASRTGMMNEDQLKAIAATKMQLAETEDKHVSEYNFDPRIQAMLDGFTQANVKEQYKEEIDAGEVVEYMGYLIPAKKAAELKASRDKLFADETTFEVATAATGALEGAMMTPEEVLAQSEEAAAAAQALTAKDQTKDLDKAQEKEFADLKRKFPGMTEKGFFAALKKKDMLDLATAATAAGGGPEATAAILEKLMGGGSLNADEIGNAMYSGQDEILGKHGYRGGTSPVTPVDPTSPVTPVDPTSVYPTSDSGVDDFIYRGGAMGGTITSINSADELLGAKPGGPVDKALSGGRGGNSFHFNISGGDTAKVYAVVKKALRESGVRPPPGTG